MVATLDGLASQLAQRDQQIADLQRNLQQLITLLSLTESLSRELDLDALLRKMVVNAVELLDAEQGAIGLVDEERHAIRHKALYNLPEALLHIDFAEGVGLSGQVYAARHPVILSDYGSQVHIPLDDEAGRRIRSAVSVPIWWQGRLIGVFSIGTSSPRRVFDERDAELLSLFAKHAAIAIENARLYGEAERLAHLNERHAIARELHDSVTQSLFTIMLLADAARNYLRSGQEDPGVTIDLLYQAARDALSEMRALIYQLRPAPLEGEGLITAMRKLAEATQVRHGLSVEVRQSGVRHLPPQVEDALFRIAQEAMHNAVKHAQARRIAVELRLTDVDVTLTVADDGYGFDVAGTPSSPQPSVSRAGLGLISMRERAEQLGGSLLVNSVPNSGTQIEAWLPLRGEVEDDAYPNAYR